MTGQDLTYALAFSAGLLSFLSPCVLPLVPIYLGYLTGQGAGNERVSLQQSRTVTLLHGTAVVLGFSLVFMAWGALGGAAGSLVTHPWFLRIGALLLIVMGLHLVGLSASRSFIRRSVSSYIGARTRALFPLFWLAQPLARAGRPVSDRCSPGF